jgi:heat shock transcription factor
MKNIHRSKPVHSHSSQNSRGQGAAAAAPITESECRNLNAEIQRLQDDKEQLLLELQRQDEEWKAKQTLLHYAKDRLEKLEQRQQTILSSVGQVLQKPRDESSLWPLTENSKRKRKFLRNIPFSNDASIEDNMETSCVLPSENAESESILSLSKGRLDLLESSLKFWENIVHDISETSFKSHSNLDFDDSMSCANSPKISCVQLDFEVQHKSPGIDTYSKPAAVIVPHPVALNEQPVVTAPVTTGNTHNDDFWEQLLTENPPSASDDEAEQSRLHNDGWPGGLSR